VGVVMTLAKENGTVIRDAATNTWNIGDRGEDNIWVSAPHT